MFKKLITVAIFCLGLGVQSWAGPHKATLTWTDVINPNGTTYTVFRATGDCTGTPAWSQLASGVAVQSYVDTTVVSGSYCYEVFAIYSGKQSLPSNMATGTVPPAAVIQLQLTIGN